MSRQSRSVHIVVLLDETNGVLIAELEEGTTMNVFEFGENGAWARVQPERIEGWVHRSALQLTFNSLHGD